MFKREYTFYGVHAEKVQELTSKFADSGARIFQRNVDVLLFAPIVGFLFGRTATIDQTNNTTTKIFTDQMIREDRGLRLNYQLVTLLDKNNSVDKEKRINSAFRHIGKDYAVLELQRFNEYILGGVEVLHEKIISLSTLDDDYLINIYDFLEDIYERYNEKIETDDMMEFIDIARSG